LPCIGVPQEINNHFGIVHQKLQTGYCPSLHGNHGKQLDKLWFPILSR